MADISPSIQKPNGCDFPFVSGAIVRQKFNLTKALLDSLRTVLPQGVYWQQPSKRKIFYNLKLLGDYLMRGGSVDSPEHQQIVQTYQQHFSALISTP